MNILRNLKRKTGSLIHHTASKVRRIMWGTGIDKTNYIDPVTRTIHSVLFDQDYMRNVFKYLDLPEKNSFSYVCHDWNSFAHEYYKSEKTYNCDVIYLYWDLKGLLEDLKARPLTKSLTFDRNSYRDKDVRIIIDCIINNIHKLQHVIMSFPQPDDIIAILNRYETLETIQITCTDTALQKSIQAFKNRKLLVTLQLNIIQSNSIIIDEIFKALGSGIQHVQRFHIDVKTCNREKVYLLPNFQDDLLSETENLIELYADFYESITNRLFKCKKLAKLNAGVNNMKESFDFSQLQQLKTLSVGFYGSCLNGIILETFQRSFKKGVLVKLQSLLVYSNDKHLEIGILRTVTNLQGLKCLRLINIDSNTLNRDLPLLSRFRSMSKLGIRGSSCINNSSLVHIGKLVDLEELALHPSLLTDSGLLSLKPCQKLKTLTLSGCSLTEIGVLNFLSALPKLSYISLEKSGIDISSVSHIRNIVGPHKTIVI